MTSTKIYNNLINLMKETGVKQTKFYSSYLFSLKTFDSCKFICRPLYLTDLNYEVILSWSVSIFRSSSQIKKIKKCKRSSKNNQITTAARHVLQ